jgi:hypothetical protein
MAIVSCCDAAPVFELTEHALDEVSSAICLVIERIGRAPCGGWSVTDVATKRRLKAWGCQAATPLPGQGLRRLATT